MLSVNQVTRVGVGEDMKWLLQQAVTVRLVHEYFVVC